MLRASCREERACATVSARGWPGFAAERGRAGLDGVRRAARARLDVALVGLASDASKQADAHGSSSRRSVGWTSSSGCSSDVLPAGVDRLGRDVLWIFPGLLDLVGRLVVEPRVR